MKPQRIQLSRRKGFDLQAVSLALNGLPAAKVARPSKWGNPYKLSDYPRTPDDGEISAERFARVQRDNCVERFKQNLLAGNLDVSVDEIRSELRGKNLACFCNLKDACHADVLLEVANQGATP